MKMDYLYYPYPSHRMATFARKGMVATSQPLAAQAGLEMLKRGGNAVDAAIATAACLTVVEPTSNGIGGDSFALVWMKGELHGLNASGPAPRRISIEAVKERGFDAMPRMGWIPVTVPGVPAAWAELSKRFGKLPLSEVMQPAIEYAEGGVSISPTVGAYWKSGYEKVLAAANGDEFKSWFETFTVNGRVPEVGEIWRSADHAKTLRSIAATYAESFYRGELMEHIDAFSKKYNGFLSADDLTCYKPEWVRPIHVRYRDYDVWEMPPNGQGLVALMALNILNGFKLSEKEAVETYHKQLEAMKLAFSDGKAYITDVGKMKVGVEQLLSDEFARARRELIGETALTPEPGSLPKGGTVYLATADEDGNMVSYIQSNYVYFGSGLVVPGTGIALQNRGSGFSLDPTHHNALMPGKKTYHTIIPGFLTKGKTAIGPFGVMGGYMQPQGHVQVVMNMVDFHLNPQAALDAPRWQWVEGKKVLVEPSFPKHIAQALMRRGHELQYAFDGFGSGQVIWRDPQTGVFIGGAEPRVDASVAAY